MSYLLRRFLSTILRQSRHCLYPLGATYVFRSFISWPFLQWVVPVSGSMRNPAVYPLRFGSNNSSKAAAVLALSIIVSAFNPEISESIHALYSTPSMVTVLVFLLLMACVFLDAHRQFSKVKESSNAV